MNEVHSVPVNENKLEKMEFWSYCNVIFIDKYLKNNEPEYLIHYA